MFHFYLGRTESHGEGLHGDLFPSAVTSAAGWRTIARGGEREVVWEKRYVLDNGLGGCCLIQGVGSGLGQGGGSQRKES